MGYGDKEECCARLLSQVLDGIASSRLSGMLQKAVACRVVELALRGGPRPRAGHMEDEGGSAGAREGAAAAFNRHQGGNHGSCADHATEARRESHAEQIVDVPSPQCHEYIVEMTRSSLRWCCHDTHWSSEENGSRARASGFIFPDEGK